MRHFNLSQRTTHFWWLGMILAFIGFVFPAIATAQNSPQYVPGRLLVKFRSDVPSVRIQSMINSAGARVMGEIPQIGVKILQLPSNISPTAMARSFGQQREVIFAEVDWIAEPANGVPNDPRYPAWHLTKINASSAWSIHTGSSDLIIAIVDTGIDGSHPDLAAKMVPGWNIYSNSPDTSDATGHGTAVAGTAAAIGNNGTGVASLAWNCRIMPVRVTSSTGSSSSSLIASGILWAADRGAKVINASFKVHESSTLLNALSNVYNRGIVSVFAAGNDGSFDSAGDNPYMLRVSATTSNDALASWSATGNNIDLAAPGVGISTTLRGGGYGTGDGTSFAAPIVAGIAALILSVNPALSPLEVGTILKQSADDLGSIGWDPQYGWGRVNAARALQMTPGSNQQADTTAPTVSFSSPASGSTLSGTVSVQVNASDNIGVSAVNFYVDGVLHSTKTASPYTFTWDTTRVSNASHTLRAVASDAAGNSSSSQMSVNVSNLTDATPPVVSITSPSNGATVSGNKLTISVNASDSSGISRVELYVDGQLKSTITSAPYTFNQNPRNWTAGAHTLQAKAYDGAGNVGTSTIITVYK